jgi:putative pyrroloquinoline-quinone binding quinoprotein
MSDDFIGGLQHDLVEAMERYERRSAPGAAALHPRLLRPAARVRLVAAAAIVLAVAVGARDLAPETPPARPHVVPVLQIGGSPMGAALAAGSLWVSDFTGSVVRVDPRDRRVIARITMPGAPEPIAAGAGSLWVQTAGAHCQGNLVRIDARSGRIVARTPRSYPSGGEQAVGTLTVGGGGLWVKRGCVDGHDGVERLDPAGAVTARVALASVDGLATAAGNLWVIGHDGTLTQIDAATGRVRQRWPRLAPLADPNTTGTKALVADGAGVWVLSTGRAAILHIEHGRVVRQLAVDASTRPLLTKASDGLWIATTDRNGSHHRLIRLDPDSGKPTATLELGEQRPIALIPTNHQLYVLTSNGKILVIRS